MIPREITEMVMVRFLKLQARLELFSKNVRDLSILSLIDGETGSEGLTQYTEATRPVSKETGTRPGSVDCRPHSVALSKLRTV